MVKSEFGARTYFQSYGISKLVYNMLFFLIRGRYLPIFSFLIVRMSKTTLAINVLKNNIDNIRGQPEVVLHSRTRDIFVY